MNEDISRRVIEVCREIDLEVRSYSGRAMYGADCVGVDCDDTHRALAQIINALMETGAPGDAEAADFFQREGAVRADSMGLGSILYFPRLPWVEDEEGSEGGEDDDAAVPE